MGRRTARLPPRPTPPQTAPSITAGCGGTPCAQVRSRLGRHLGVPRNERTPPSRSDQQVGVVATARTMCRSAAPCRCCATRVQHQPARRAARPCSTARSMKSFRRRRAIRVARSTAHAGGRARRSRPERAQPAVSPGRGPGRPGRRCASKPTGTAASTAARSGPSSSAGRCCSVRFGRRRRTCRSRCRRRPRRAQRLPHRDDRPDRGALAVVDVRGMRRTPSTSRPMFVAGGASGSIVDESIQTDWSAVPARLWPIGDRRVDPDDMRVYHVTDFKADNVIPALVRDTTSDIEIDISDILDQITAGQAPHGDGKVVIGGAAAGARSVAGRWRGGRVERSGRAGHPRPRRRSWWRLLLPACRPWRPLAPSTRRSVSRRCADRPARSTSRRRRLARPAAGPRLSRRHPAGAAAAFRADTQYLDLRTGRRVEATHPPPASLPLHRPAPRRILNGSCRPGAGRPLIRSSSPVRPETLMPLIWQLGQGRGEPVRICRRWSCSFGLDGGRQPQGAGGDVVDEVRGVAGAQGWPARAAPARASTRSGPAPAWRRARGRRRPRRHCRRPRRSRGPRRRVRRTARRRCPSRGSGGPARR